MKYKMNFGSEIVALPRAALAHLKDVSRERLAVLLSIAADPTMSTKKRAESLGLTESELSAAISFWLDLGIVGAEGAAKELHEDQAERDADKAQTAKKPRSSSKTKTEDERPIALDDGAPHLTTPELTDAAGKDENARLIEHCQQKMGRVFNAAEAERIVSIRAYLGVSTDFMTLLCDKLKKEGRLTPRSLENTAIAIHDNGITDRWALCEFFDRREDARKLESKVRSLYGFGRRTLTAAEKKIIEKWAEYKMSADMIAFAYELTVKNTGNASLNYSNAIIESWNTAGIKTVDEAKAHEKDFKEKTKSSSRSKKNAGQTGSSFDTDDFFENALRRSYGDEFLESYKNGGSPEGKK